MINRKILHSKKAISPILATLLLVVIAVSAIVVTYAWMTTYMGNATQQASVMPYKANVNFKENGIITIDIGNSGTASADIIQVYIGKTASSAEGIEIKSTSLPAGGIASFTVDFVWTPGETYYFKVVTTAGQAPLSFQEQAPQ
jgi:flagellin-like protein